MLDDLNELAQLLWGNWESLIGSEAGAIFGEMYCPECGGNRRMATHHPFWDSEAINQLHHVRQYDVPGMLRFLKELSPVVLVFRCVQCDASFTGLIYGKSDLVELAIFPEGRGTLATPHTPPAVVYYLDQVQRCWSVGANSAAIGMYRVALDHLLFEQGYQNGMVGKKLDNLEKAIVAGTAPVWARDMDPGYLEVLNKLATHALHTNDGNVVQQSLFDRDLLVAVKATFQTLLFRVYELPHQEKGQLSTLGAALSNLNRSRTTNSSSGESVE